MYVFTTQGAPGARGVPGPRGAAGREVCESVCMGERKIQIAIVRARIPLQSITVMNTFCISLQGG